MSNNTYGSHCLRSARVITKHIKFDTLFLNLYDYWNEFHHKRYFLWHSGAMMRFSDKYNKKVVEKLAKRQHYIRKIQRR